MNNEATEDRTEADSEREIARRKVLGRLKRVRGQLDGVIRMVEEDRDCEAIVTQIAAASKALERAGFMVVAESMAACVMSETLGETPTIDRAKLEKIFLSLA